MKTSHGKNRLTNHILNWRKVSPRNLIAHPFITIILLVITVLLSLRLLNFVSLYAVNLLFWDQWDFLTPLFEKQSLWTMFSYQHGPHRQGLGLLLTNLTANLSQWDTRAESISIALLVIAAMLSAFALKRSIHGALSLTDVIIPLAFLNLTQYEIFIGTPNPAHSAAPLFLSILYCLAWLIPNYGIKTLVVLILNLLLLFTGFGVFMSIITVGLFILESLRNVHLKQRGELVVSGLAVLLSVFSIGIFLVGYTFKPAVGCFASSKINLLNTLFFMSLMFSRFIRLGFSDLLIISKVVGFSLLSASIIVFSYHTYKLTQIHGHARRASIVIAVLIGYTLLFSLGTAIGRTCIGLEHAFSSRYVTLMIPAFLGLYLHIYSVSKVIPRKVLTGVFLLLMSVSLFSFSSSDLQIIDRLSVKKERWKRCFLEYESVEQCDKAVGFQIYPDAASTRLDWKLDYLKQNDLNLYLDVHE